MKNYVTLLLVGFLALTYVKAASRIVGAADAPPGKFPYMAMIKDRAGYMCGGSIIHKKYVLTAAHCVYELFARQLEVIVGTHKFDEEGGDRYLVKNIIVHEDHQRMPESYSKNDLAILELEEEIKLNDRVQLVKLPSKTESEVFDNTKVVLAGFGYIELKFLKNPKVLQFLENEILNHKKCAFYWKELKSVTIENTQICTKAPDGVGACLGDSGSALITENGIQVGIVSFGLPCAMGYPDIYTNVHHYIDWINEKISH